MDLTFGTKYHRRLYFMGLVLIAAGLSVSKVLVSIGTIWIGVNWIWEGNYLAKWRLLLARKSVMVLVAIFVLHVIGLLWSPDLNDGTRDVRIKIPLLVLPLLREPLRHSIENNLKPYFCYLWPVFYSQVFEQC